MLPMLLTANPNTGDINASILWIVIGALAASGATLVGILLSSRKNKGRRKR